jgi:NADP-dependent 3-hydroxy acid dehydrogenase YdfG
MMEGLLNGRTALVTRASRGIGKQISFALAQLGYSIIIPTIHYKHILGGKSGTEDIKPAKP